jgi:hypothetical protein
MDVPTASQMGIAGGRADAGGAGGPAQDKIEKQELWQAPADRTAT